MAANEAVKIPLRHGDTSLFFNLADQKYYRETTIISDLPNDGIQLLITLTPMVQLTTIIDGQEDELFFDKLPTNNNHNNNLESLPVLPNPESTNTSNNIIIVINNNENNNNEDESRLFDNEISGTEEIRNEVHHQDHTSTVESKNKNRKRKPNVAPAIVSTEEVKIQTKNNKKKNKKETVAAKVATPGQDDSMLLDGQVHIMEENINIVHQDDHNSSEESTTKNRTRKRKNPTPVLSTVESKTKQKSKTKSKLTKYTTSNSNDDQTNNSNNPTNTATSSTDYSDLGKDPKLNKEILHNITVENCKHLKPREPQPSTSTSVTELHEENKKRSNEIVIAPLNAKGESFAHETERAKTKGSHKNYDGIDRRKKIEELNKQQELLNESEYGKTMKMLAGVNENFKNINTQPSTSKAATTPNDFKWSYEKIGPRYKLDIPEINNKIKSIKTIPVKAVEEDVLNNNNNEINKCVSEDNIVSDLENLLKEEGTEIEAVFVVDDVSNYPELAKKFNVLKLNGTEETSRPPPATSHYFQDSAFDLPYLKFDCDLFETEVPTSTLLEKEENIKIWFQKEKVDSLERPHAYLCALFHCLRGRLVMTILTRTSTTNISATFASCIKWCPTSNDVKSTWGPECHQKKFSRDLIAVGGNIIGQRPKFMIRNVLNEKMPNVSAGRRIFDGRLKPDEDVKGVIMYFILNAYYEALENSWIQLELAIQQTITHKNITISDQGKLCMSALHCPKCDKSLEEIEKYRFHVMQCVFNTHPDNFLRIPSLTMIAGKYKRESKKEDLQFSKAIQSYEDTHPEIDEDDDNENGSDTESDEQLEKGQIPRNEMSREMKIVMRILKSEVYACPTCAKDFLSWNNLQQHIAETECAKLPFIHNMHLCFKNDCSKAFKTLFGLRTHLRKFHVETILTPEDKLEILEMHKKNEFVCHECNDKPHTTYTALAQHTQRSDHSKVYKFLRGWSICNFKDCYADFDSKDMLKTHMKNKHPEKSQDKDMEIDNEPEVDGDDIMASEDEEISQ